MGWAPWCGPCRMIAPLVDELSKEYKGKLKAVKLNTRVAHRRDGVRHQEHSHRHDLQEREEDGHCHRSCAKADPGADYRQIYRRVRKVFSSPARLKSLNVV